MRLLVQRNRHFTEISDSSDSSWRYFMSKIITASYPTTTSIDPLPKRQVKQGTRLLFSVLLILIALAKWSPAQQADIIQKHFGEFEGKPVSLYTLKNQHGMVAEISDFGGVVTKLIVPDRDGEFGDVVLGHTNFEKFINDSSFFGAIVGRFANRIANGTFTLDDVQYQLATNNAPNTLHGGNVGFNKRLWAATTSLESGQPQLKLNYLSPDGEEGFPGNLDVTVTYTLTADNGLKIDYLATTDKPTVCNLSHHGYFNLAGMESDSVLDHNLQLFCDNITPNNQHMIPTGDLMPVKDTPFDFLQPRKIGERIDEEDPQLKLGHGYDHNFVINGEGGTLRRAARVHDPSSGRVMEVMTTDYGVEFYTANFLSGPPSAKSELPMKPRMAFCLECQRFPDTPNQPQFPSATLKPGEKYEKTTIYQFSTDRQSE